jgi:hypothetical protein
MSIRKTSKIRENRIELASGEILSDVVNATKNFTELTDSDDNNDLTGSNEEINIEFNTPDCVMSNGITPREKEYLFFEPFETELGINPRVKLWNGETNAFFNKGENLLKNEINNIQDLISRGDCENDIYPPTVWNEDSVSLNNATFEQSKDFHFKGAFSYKYTKTSALGTASYVKLHKSEANDKTHGLRVGATYKLSAWIYIPSTDGPTYSSIRLRLNDWNGSDYNESSTFAENILDEWQCLTVTHTIRAKAIGTHFGFVCENTGEANDFFYVDHIKMEELKTMDGANEKWQTYKSDVSNFDKKWQNNKIARGDCESTTPPMIIGQTIPSAAINTTSWARSDIQSKSGNYSYRHQRTDGTSDSYIHFVDTVAVDNLNSFIPGKTYKFSGWVYIPDVANKPSLSNVFFYSEWYDGLGVWTPTISNKPTAYNTWQELTFEITYPNEAEAVHYRLAQGAESVTQNGSVVYVDDIKIEVLEEKLDLPIVRGNKMFRVEANQKSSDCWCMHDGIKFMSDGLKAIQIIAKKGTAPVSQFRITDISTAITKLNCSIVWSTQTVTSVEGEIVETEWIDSETVWVYCKTNSIIKANINRIYLSATLSATGNYGDYTYWGALQIEDQDYATPYIPPETKRKEHINIYTFETPKQFTIDMIINPKFPYDVAGGLNFMNFLEFYKSPDNFLRIFYRPLTDKISIAYKAGVDQSILESQQFDDGTSFDNINQRIRITVSLDLTTGTTSGSKLWINGIFQDDTWDLAINNLTETINQLYIGGKDGRFADSLIEYVNIYSGTTNQTELNADFTGKTLLFTKTFEDYKNGEIISSNLIETYSTMGWLERGDCESSETEDLAPCVYGEFTGNPFNDIQYCTAARDGTQAFRGNYSYKYTSTNTNQGYWGLQSSVDPNNLTFQGIVPGETYKFSAWFYNPSGQATSANLTGCGLWIYWSEDGVNFTEEIKANHTIDTKDEWVYLEVKIRIPFAITGILFRIYSETGAAKWAVGDFFYVDEIKLEKISISNPLLFNQERNTTKRGCVGFFPSFTNILKDTENIDSPNWSPVNCNINVCKRTFKGSKFTRLVGNGNMQNNSIYQDFSIGSSTNNEYFVSCVAQRDSSEDYQSNEVRTKVSQLIVYEMSSPSIAKVAITIYWEDKRVEIIHGRDLIYEFYDDNTCYIGCISKKFSGPSGLVRFQFYGSLSLSSQTLDRGVSYICRPLFTHINADRDGSYRSHFLPYHSSGTESYSKLLYNFKWTNQGTIEFWIKSMFHYNSYHSKRLIGISDNNVNDSFDIQFCYDSINSKKYLASFAGETIRFGNAGNGYQENVAFTSNKELQKWTHIKFSWDNDKRLFSIYADGQHVATSENFYTVPIKEDSYKTLSIGGHPLSIWPEEISCSYFSDFCYKPYYEISTEHYNKTKPYYTKNRIIGKEGSFKIDKKGNAFFNEIYTRLGNAKDIVESGFNTNGYYIKFSNGNAIAWGSTDVPSSAPDSMTVYYPFTFISQPMTIVSMAYDYSNTGDAIIGNQLNDSFMYYYSTRNSSRFLALGRWK